MKKSIFIAILIFLVIFGLAFSFFRKDVVLSPPPCRCNIPSGTVGGTGYPPTLPPFGMLHWYSFDTQKGPSNIKGPCNQYKTSEQCGQFSCTPTAKYLGTGPSPSGSGTTSDVPSNSQLYITSRWSREGGGTVITLPSPYLITVNKPMLCSWSPS